MGVQAARDDAGVRISLTVPVFDPRDVAPRFAAAEAAGFDGAFTFEAAHDPFLPLVAAAGSTTRLRLGTAVAIGFARNPMVLANIGYDLQVLSGGRFVLGLGSQIRTHIEHRFSETWSAPAERMREVVEAIRAIWATWEGAGPLDFRGRHYQHTLMTPAFDPGPNPFGSPPILLGGVGPKMVAVAGEVADGLVVHPFATRRSIEERVLPALDEGLARSGRTRADVELVWPTIVAPWSDDEQRQPALTLLRQQLGFYASTPAYRTVLDVHGWGALQPELRALTKAGRWDDMAAAVPDELVDAVAVAGPRAGLGARLAARVTGITDSVGLVGVVPDEHHLADVVADLRTAADRAGSA